MQLVNKGEKLTQKDIEVIQKQIGYKLTAEYTEFLLKNNGGEPESEVEFSFIGDDGQEQGSDIQYFYNKDELLEAFENLTAEELIAKDYISIATDSFGNEILVYLGEGDNRGNIYFAYVESETEDGSWYLAKVADSFNEFMGIIKPMEF